MKKTLWFAVLVAVFLVVGCSNSKNEGGGQQMNPPNESTENPSTPNKEANTNPSTGDEVGSTATSSEAIIEAEQKKMALNMLNAVAQDAKEGKVYRPDNGFRIGQTERDAVHKTIGEPEEKEAGYEHYHGSMGNPSVAFKYDGNGILEEARYFGTNVERQTNLGGITEKDLTEQLGEPLEIREMKETEEKNIRYHRGEFELQFIIGKDGTVDHVNLKQFKVPASQ